ncbi:MAG: hypothetical protein NTV32_02840 [Gammaproteobacteria bacterium]|nr:hypothetical protein [Gammaproteobacteria bacterium]
MKDQNDDNFNEESLNENTSSTSHPNISDDFDEEDLSQFDDIHEEYEETEDQASAPPHHTEDYDEDVTEDEAYANLDDTATAQGVKKGSNLISLMKDNWLYIILVLIVVTVAGYLIMGTLFPNTPATAPATVTPATQTAFNSLPATGQTSATAAAATNTSSTTAQPNPTAPGTPATAEPAMISMSATQMQQLLQGFSSTVQDSMKTIQTTIQASGAPATNEKLATLQTQLTALDGNISTLNSNLNAADTRLGTTQQQLSQVLAQETANQEKLTLRAVVPGRAWLVDGKGNTISVTVGSTLGYIGTVTEIDSDQDNSQVVTSSGYIFK